MPRAAAGEDFLLSIGELFEEASKKNLADATAVAFIRDQVVALLLNVSETTAAKARATCTIKLPDGSEPDTYVQLPPATFQIDEQLAEELNRAVEAAEFIDVLAEAFQLHREERRSKPGTKLGKRKSSEMELVAGRKKKVIFRNTKTPDTRSLNPPRIQPSNTAAALNIQKGEKCVFNRVDFQIKASTTTIPRSEEEILRSVTKTQSTSRMFSKSPSPGDSESETTESPRSDSFSFKSSDNSSVSLNSPPPGADYTKQEAASAAKLKRLIDDVWKVTAREWESYRPKLVEALMPYAELEDSKLRSLGPSVSRDSQTRLDGAIAFLANEIAKLPAKNWSHYESRLRRFCSSDTLPTLSFRQRLWKVVGMVYVDEEVEVLASGEWERLESVAKIVVIVSQAIGPEGEDSREAGQKWFHSKVRDIRFLRKMMLSVREKDEEMAAARKREDIAKREELPSLKMNWD